MAALIHLCTVSGGFCAMLQGQSWVLTMAMVCKAQHIFYLAL